MGSPNFDRLTAGLQRLAGVARVLQLLAAAACLGALALVWLQDAPMTGEQLLIFYGAPTLALLFFGLAASSGPALRVNLAVATGSAIFALYGGELVLQMIPAPLEWEGIAEELGGSDARTKLEVVQDLRAQGVYAFPQYSPWLLRGLHIPIENGGSIPLGQSPSFSTTVACNEGQGWLVYETDQYGFRGNGPWVAGVQVAVLGDSFVNGQCVGDGQEIPAQLRKRWPSTWNLGVAGAGPLHELAVLREFASLLRPSFVVWVYYEGNDQVDLGDELQSPLLTRYLVPSFRLGLAERQGEVDRYLSRLLDSIFAATVEAEVRGETPARPRRTAAATLAELVKLTRMRGLLGLGASFPRANPLGSLPEIVRLGRDATEEWGGRMVLVYMPAYSRFTPSIGEPNSGHDAFIGMAADLGIPMVDLVEVFLRRGDPTSLWIHPRGHLNPEGYSVAAEAIAATLDRLVPAL